MPCTVLDIGIPTAVLYTRRTRAHTVLRWDPLKVHRTFVLFMSMPSPALREASLWDRNGSETRVFDAVLRLTTAADSSAATAVPPAGYCLMYPASASHRLVGTMRGRLSVVMAQPVDRMMVHACIVSDHLRITCALASALSVAFRALSLGFSAVSGRVMIAVLARVTVRMRCTWRDLVPRVQNIESMSTNDNRTQRKPTGSERTADAVRRPSVRGP